MPAMLKLLIVKTSSLGDVIHNLPIVHDILQHYPNTIIDWVVESSFADIPKLHPAVNHVIPVAIRRWRKAIFAKQTWSEIKAAKHQLSAKKYDVVLDTQGLIKSGLLTYFSQGRKHGYDKNSAREPLASYFYNFKHQVSRSQHAVLRNRTLAALALGYPIPESPPNYGITPTTASQMALPLPYIVGLHGTSRDSKLWPIDYWISLGETLADQQTKLVLPWASEAECKRAQKIAASLNNAIVLPKLTIAQLADIINQAKAAVGVDTGLSHLATALSTPTVAIYTDTDPSLTGVLAGANAPAINLGNIGKTPSVSDVTNALSQLLEK